MPQSVAIMPQRIEQVRELVRGEREMEQLQPEIKLRHFV